MLQNGPLEDNKMPPMLEVLGYRSGEDRPQATDLRDGVF